MKNMTMTAEQEEAWYNELKAVDTHVRRPKEWIKCISAVLVKNGFLCMADLKGATIQECQSDLGTLNGGGRAFLQRALTAANEVKAPAAGDALQLLQQAVGAKPQKTVVNIPAALNGIRLSELSPSAWPQAAVVDWLHEEGKKLRAAGVNAPFIFVDLKKKCMPNWAIAHQQPVEDEEEVSHSVLAIAKAIRKGDDGSQKDSTHLSFVCWSAAFHRYALAADFVRQWNLSSALAHYDICLRVAEEARTRGKPQWLGVKYDEVCRKEWAELARANVSGFDVNKVCLTMDKELVTRAEASVPQSTREKSSYGHGYHDQHWGYKRAHPRPPSPPRGSKRQRY